MDLTLLKTFCAVAETLNISRTADVIGLTQPAVSQQIKQLERTVGSELFLRHPLRLTETGQHLLVNAKEILSQWQRTLEFVQTEKDLKGGRLSIACSDVAMRYCLLDKIRRYREAYPGVELSVINRTSSGACDAVRAGEADLAIGIHTVDQDKLIHKPLMHYHEVAVVPVGHSLADRKSISAAQLAQEPLLLLEEKAKSRLLTQQWFAEAQIHALNVMALGSVDAQLDMARIGLGVALIPDFAVPADVVAIKIKAMKRRQLVSYYQRIKPAMQAWFRLA